MALRHLDSLDAALGFLADHGVRALTTDSRRVAAGSGFIAWPGYATDGRAYVASALAAGAAACLVEADGVDSFGFDDPRIAAVPGLKALTGPLASRFHREPSAALTVVATTGTNGKTSTAWWTAQALGALGRRAGVIGTLGVGEPGRVEPTGLTTPDPVTVQATLRRFVDDGFTACALEASSIGIVEHRLDGTRIDVALYTNFTRDHLDYHGTMTAYWHAKEQLFAWSGLAAASINVDDEQGEALARSLRGRGLDLWTCSSQGPARLQALGVRYDAGGLAFEVQEAGAARATLRTALIGEYNVSNLLVVLGGLRALGVPLAEAAAACERLTPVPGRMQRVVAEARGPEVVVDYAHTPDALEKALEALRPMARARGGVLWCVFGCGGNRDATKRPMMGAIAERLAGRVVVTSDNPRDEAPEVILAQIAAGMNAAGRAELLADRRQAITRAVTQASAADIVLIAGKGHEDYQEIAGRRLPFSDVAEAEAALRLREAA